MLLIGIRDGGQSEEVGVDREGSVQQTNEDSYELADQDTEELLLSLQRDQAVGNLGPSLPHVDSKDDDGTEVDEHPASVLEKLNLQLVDITDGNQRGVLVISEERPHPLRADHVRIGLSEAELLKMHDHEGQEGQTGHDESQLVPAASGFDESELFELVSSAQCNDNMQQGSEGNILFDEIGLETESGPVKADVEESVGVEVVSTTKHVQVTESMDDDKHDEEDG